MPSTPIRVSILYTEVFIFKSLSNRCSSKLSSDSCCIVIVEGHEYAAGTNVLAAYSSKRWAENETNLSSPFIEKQSLSEEQPSFSINCSTMILFLIEWAKACSKASFKFFSLSTRVTPLEPAESVGFTIRG